MKVVVLGRGKLGRALSEQLAEKGVAVSLERGRQAGTNTRARTRTEARGESVIYVLAVPDGSLRAVAQRLAARVARRDVVLHCAGARGLAELEACAALGAATGVFHPLVSFASRRAFAPLAGTTFVAQGAPRALRATRWLCRQLGAHCLAAPITGPAYHAAAAFLANGSAALAYGAQRILVELGLSERSAERALAGLLASVANNVRTIGVPAALTGPVARGDVRTVKEHTRALALLLPELAQQYRRVQPIIEACARALHASGRSARVRARAKQRDTRAKRRAQRHK